SVIGAATMVLDPVSIIDTELSSALVMKAFLACESIAIPSGFLPTLMDVFTALDAASITDTVSSPELVMYTDLAAESTAIPTGACPTLMVAVTFGTAAGFADWPDAEAGADDCDVFVLFDEQPPTTSAETMSGYVRKATCFIAYLLLDWQPRRESKHRQAFPPMFRGRG